MPPEPFANITMEDPGQRLKRVRERLGLKYREVEQASLSIARRRGNDEFAVVLSRLADIENKGTVPTMYRLYSLCAIYRLDMVDVLGWFGVDLTALPADAAAIELSATHPVAFNNLGAGLVQMPLGLDPGLDLRHTTHVSRFVQKWGALPVVLLNDFDVPHLQYGFIGTDDWSMDPVIPPGSFVLIDERQRKPDPRTGWVSEYERPVYFFEHRSGFCCAWCSVEGDRTVLLQHPSSHLPPMIFDKPGEVENLGRVTGIAMRLDRGLKRRGGP